MNVVVEYEDTKNKYEIPIMFLAKELNIPLQTILDAVKRAVEKY